MNLGSIPSWLIAAVLVVATADARAFVSGDESEKTPIHDADYAAGVEAFEQENWQGVVDNMKKVVDRRPWHDNAFSRMGYAYRKLGDFANSLAAYDQALELNPHNRGALEYLGEAYLDLDRVDDAKAMLDRLEAACKGIAVGLTNGGWKSECEEWAELKQAYDEHVGAQAANQ